MASRPKCAYCDCSAIDCLAQCASTGLYFCNGKGATTQSHIIHHLKSIKQGTINLPPENKFSDTPLECYICRTNNIFGLGFVEKTDKSKIYIVCRSCQFDEQLRDLISLDSFQPFVCDGQIYHEIVRVPDENEYQKIPLSKAVEVRNQALALLGSSIGDEDEQIRAQLKYDSVQDYAELMKSFVEAEHNEIEQQEQSRHYGTIRFKWESPRIVTFRALPQLFKATTLGCSLNFSAGETIETAIVINRLNTMYLTARFNTDSSFYNKDTGISVQVVVSNVPFKRQISALDSILDQRPPFHWLILEMFLGITDKLQHHNKMKRPKLVFEQPVANQFPILNEFQQKAVSYALNNRFSLIQGPPGTGKTTVIAALAYSFVQNGIKPVLICAQSNVSADFATLRVSQTGLDVVRIVSTSRAEITKDIDPYTTRTKAIKRFGQDYESLINSNQAENDNDIRWQIMEYEQQIIEDSDAVCTTCVSAGRALMRNIRFKVVIFDESCQCLDPDLLIGLNHIAEQAVLVGDHKQLGPMVMSHAARRGRYNLALMERLVLLGVHPLILRIQYRMHSAISSFPSTLFYNKLILNGVDDKKDRCFNGKPNTDFFPWPNPDCPICFWNVMSTEESYDSATSYINQAEVGCVNQILTRLWENGVTASDIGIITPYTGQQTFLIEHLPLISGINDPDFFSELEISSVDAFQGREKNFIIFSCVRANQSNEIGFLNDRRRLNVSLTRAKFGIFILANAATFTKNQCWYKLMDLYKSVNAFVEGDNIDNLKPSSFAILAKPDDDDDIADTGDEIGIA